MKALASRYDAILHRCSEELYFYCLTVPTTVDLITISYSREEDISPGRMSSFAASSSGIHRAVLIRPNVSYRQRLRQATEAALPSSGRSTRPIITTVQRSIPQSSVRSLSYVRLMVRRRSWLRHRKSIVKTRDRTGHLHCTVVPFAAKDLSLRNSFPFAFLKVTELAQVANEIDSETITTIVAALLGVSAGIGVPVFFVMQV